ncbi:unnamed protein product [Symbiodinium sp. CCMP2592]|nr:unnamed protein product [Symbiodinium sp. CCMP2592]
MDPSVLEDADLAALESELSADLQIDGGDFGDQLSHSNQDCDTAERRPLNPWLLLDSGEDFQAVSEDASQPGVEAAASEDDASAEVQWYKQVAEDFVLSDVESHQKQSQWSLVEQHPSVPAASPRVTAEGYQTALSAAFHAVPAKATLSLPWESGVWSALFGASASGDWLQQVKQMLCEEDSVQGQIGLLEDFFRGRAPSTLLKRAKALAKVANWLQEKGAPAYPISEKLFYEFLPAERALGAPASRLKGYHEAIVFSRFVLGVAGLELATASRRCLGATKSDEPRDRKQAQPLTVQQLLELHRRLDSEGEDLWNRLFCGATLCVVYARSRWALDYDTLGDIAYLEITAGKWVRRLLDCEPAEGCPNKITSHSFKATLLSMAAKRGYSIEDRLQMGYHSVPGRMALVYSRDGAARSLRLLEVMLQEIRSGFYLPDSTRSGRLKGPAREILEHAPLPGENQSAAGDLRIRAGPEADKTELASDFGDGAVEILGSEDEQEAAATERAADSEHVTTDSSGSESSDLEATKECWNVVVWSDLCTSGPRLYVSTPRSALSVEGPLERRLAQEVFDAMDRSPLRI